MKKYVTHLENDGKTRKPYIPLEINIPIMKKIVHSTLEVKSQKKTNKLRSLVAMSHGDMKSKISCHHGSWLQEIQNLLSP